MAVSASVQKRSRSEYFNHPTVKKAQKIHFYLLDILPIALSVMSGIVLTKTGISKIDFFIFLGMYFSTVIGIELGYHRLFSHGAFQVHPVVGSVLNILGAMAGQGPAIAWASNHRHHHRYSDQEGDTHSPHVGQGTPFKRFLYSHLFWKYQYRYPSPAFYTPDLLKNRKFMFVDRKYYFWVILGLVIPAILGFVCQGSWRGGLTALLLGGFIRVSLAQHLTWCINSAAHLFGRKAFQTSDESRNIRNPLFVVLTLGGSWHNNHHAFPSSAMNSLDKGQVDPCYWLLRLMQKVKLVSHLKIPSSQQIELRRLVA